MAIPVQEVFDQVRIQLKDPKGVRWPDFELLLYLNSGVKTLINLRPDVCAVTSMVTPAAGTRQTLPEGAVTLIDIVSNTVGDKESIDKVDMDVLSASLREWKNATKSKIAVNYMYDQRDPYVYHLYPPSTGVGAGVEMIHSVYPADVSAKGDSIEKLSIQWKGALINYVLGRALSKDAEYGGNAQSASAYMSAFATELGAQLQSSSAVSPKS